MDAKINDDSLHGPTDPDEIDDEDDSPASNEFAVRRFAFDTAVEMYGTGDDPAAPDEIVQAAQTFEKYLNGQE